MTDRLLRHPQAPNALPALITALALALPVAASAQGAKSLGGGSGSGPVMTREELRLCLKQQVALKQMVETYESNRAALAQEKADIVATQKSIDDERGGVQASADKINEVNARASELTARIQEWNTAWQDFEAAGRSGPMADRQRRRLQDQKRALTHEEEALNADREKLGSTAGGDSKAVNAKVEQLNARTVAWNERNKMMASAGEEVNRARDLWAGECGDRRFREDDEIAIRQGK